MTLLSRRVRAGVAAAALAVVVPTLAPSLASSAAPAAARPAARTTTVGGSLDISPSVHVAGQAVHFLGSLGISGARSVRLQSHLGRPGDTWQDVPGSAFRTDAQGRFDFVFTAPSMFKIAYRVAGGGRATPSYLFSAPPQEITLALADSWGDSPFSTVAARSSFTVVADTTPDVRPSLGTPPPIPGRTVLLQERTGTQWRTIDSGTTDEQGEAAFTLTAPASGTRVLRARQERWTAGRNDIGWFASFPTYFSAGAPTTADGTGSDGSDPDDDDDFWDWLFPRTGSSAVSPTASSRFSWGLSRFDFAWERGQDLDSPPSRGTRPKGSWTDTSDGTGRAAPFNGGLVLQSKMEHLGDGDRGTTTATMRGNARSTGRWEFRIQGRQFETGGRPYRFRLELVPVGAAVTACSPESVLVAGFTLGTAGMELGVRSQKRGSVWRRTNAGVRLNEVPMNVAVEVAKDHVTWFQNSRPVATLKSRKAWLGTNLVPRLSLVGTQEEMNGTQIDSDWQRGWTLERGKQVRSGPGLSRQSYSATC